MGLNLDVKEISVSHRLPTRGECESLTAKNKELFKECLKFRRENDFKYIWTNQGRIYLRQNKDSPSKVITSQADLER